jgi:hypothetical protein
LRHSATRRNVALWILDGAMGIFHFHKTSGHPMALQSNQILTEMNTKNISLGVILDGA